MAWSFKQFYCYILNIMNACNTNKTRGKQIMIDINKIVAVYVDHW